MKMQTSIVLSLSLRFWSFRWQALFKFKTSFCNISYNIPETKSLCLWFDLSFPFSSNPSSSWSSWSSTNLLQSCIFDEVLIILPFLGKFLDENLLDDDLDIFSSPPRDWRPLLTGLSGSPVLRGDDNDLNLSSNTLKRKRYFSYTFITNTKLKFPIKFQNNNNK